MLDARVFFWLPSSTCEHQLLTKGDALLSLPYKNSILEEWALEDYENRNL